MINGQRLHAQLKQLATIGATKEGGVNRFSYTDEEQQANKYVQQLMKEAGLHVSFDAIGNVIGELKGQQDLPAIVLGSHIDTVPNGGKYDGALGVLAAIEVVHTLQEQQIQLQHPIKVIAFKDEEGSRFNFGMIGSRAVAGTLAAEDLLREDANGVTIAQAMLKQQFDPDQLHTVVMHDMFCYVELHIEQGKILENHDVSVGVVNGIAGPLWQSYTLTGLAEHAGATPMNLRHDALVGASLIIAEIERLAKRYPAAVATVGKLQIAPNGINVIPGEVNWTVDIRDVDEDIRNTLEREIHDYAQQVAASRELKLQIETLQRVAPVQCDSQLQQHIAHSIAKIGQPIITLPSGAGHDAMQFHAVCPVAMIFVRSKNGISHNPKEFSSAQDIEAGAQVLYETVVSIDSH